MRPMYLYYDSTDDTLYACTNRGTVLRFDDSLQIAASSSPIYNVGILTAITGDGGFLYAREISGKLLRWKKQTLAFDRMADLNFWSSPDVATFPNVSHNLFLYQDHLYVSMPTGQIGKFRKDLVFQSQTESSSKALIESVETSQTPHLAVDFSGIIYSGDVNKNFVPLTRLSHGACHQMLYDKKHERYWVTDDYHCGIGLFKISDPKKIQRLEFTNDDVEAISFNADHSQVLAACFDRYIYHFENAPTPKVIKKIGPLKYQVTHVIWAKPDIAYAVTEAGQVYRCDIETGDWIESHTGTNAVWDLQSDGDKTFWVAFEDGFVRKMALEEIDIQMVAEKNLGLGMVRRISPYASGALALTATGHVVRLDPELNIVWHYETKPLLRDLAVVKDQVLICGETGELTCLQAQTGKVVWIKNLTLPLWAVSIDPLGEKFLVAHRLCVRTDQASESSRQPSRFFIGDTKSGEIAAHKETFGNLKRFHWLNDRQFLINGNGDIATSVIDRDSLQIVKSWSAWQLNTCESAILMKNLVLTTTYGYQLNTFDIDGDLLESAFPFEDYATSLLPIGEDYFIAGGRGAFLALFAFKNGLPALIQNARFG